jgi:pimeloyl-ACP methyl ester carboxylesterase
MKKSSASILLEGIWDPMKWMLLFKQHVLEKDGFERKLAQLNGVHFGYYLKPGREEAPPLVLVHGMALFPEWWSPLFPRIPPRYPIYAPELLGFGRSPGRSLDPDRFSLKTYRQQLRLLKEEHGLDRMVLGGVSLGGWVCLDYALHYPEDVKGMILLAPAGATPDVDEDELRGLREIFDYNSAGEFNRLINDYVLHRPRKIPWLVGALAVFRSRWNGHKHLLNNLSLDDWVGERVRSITAPTALVWGCEDKVFPVSVGEELLRSMPNAKLFPLDDVAHSYLFEHADATSLAFVDGLQFVENTD